MKRLTGLFALLLLLLAPLAQAELKLSNVFSDHMVIQQEMPIRVWGWATPGQQVGVKFTSDAEGAAATVGRATAGEDGRWLVELPAMKADGNARRLTVKGDGGAIVLNDILLGEVWICSGQSNMEWRVARCANPEEEIANADHPMIRLFNVPQHIQQPTPQEDAQPSQWQVCSPQTIADFSACGYYFGRALSKELDVPIGLISTNWGGTRIEPWTPPAGFAQVERLKDIAEKLNAGEIVKKGSRPQDAASGIYNGMVAGLTPVNARGVIWYQGESNAADGLRYEYLKEALVKGWREVFQNDELAFYWVGLAGFGRGQTNEPAGGGWGPVREGQRRAMRLPHTGMAVTTDIGNEKNIHPANKQDIGQRLALWALANNYGKDVVYSGPMYKSHEVKGDTVVVHFDHVGGGLMAASKGGEHHLDPVKEVQGEALASFSLRDEAGNWHWADATIAGKTVVLKSDGVAKPTAVRYAYDSIPKVNFYNQEGLPAVPFTTVD